jgi:hypothetical protein
MRARSQSPRSDCGSCAYALSEREGEMERKTSGKRGAAIIALLAAVAALAGPGAASAAPKASTPVAPAAPAPVVSISFSIVASWAEDASWAES